LKKSLKQTGRAVLFISLAILLLWISFRDINFSDLMMSLRKAHYLWLLPAAIVSVIAFFIRARRWSLLIEPLGHKPRIMTAYHSVVTGYFVNIIFPRLGEIAKCAALGKKEKLPFDRLVGTMIVERTIDMLTVFVLLGLTLIGDSKATGSFIIIALGILTIVLYFLLRKKLSEKRFFRKIYSFSDGIIDGLKSIARLKRKWEFIFLTVFLWLLYLMMVWFPLLCLESTSGLRLGAAMFILVIGSLGMSVPVQSGIGAFHWIVSRGLLVAYGIPLEEGLAYATLSHESQLLLIALFGSVSLFALFGRKGGRILSSTVREESL
jgi:uncharacterized protein (TIRG00374 family)